MSRALFLFCGVVLILLTLVATPTVSFAQSGPNVPCVNCPDFEFHPKPETGLWNNPLDPTGTGFMLEVQGDRLAGFLFIYDDTGEPEWFLLSGTLESPPDDSEAIWVVEADLTRFAGGPCINCPSQPAMVSGSGGTVRFEFFARNFGRYRVDDGPWEHLVPLTFGALTEAAFPELTDYRLPDLEGLWVLVMDNELPDGAPDETPSFDRADSQVVWMLPRAPDPENLDEVVRYELRMTFQPGPLGTPPPLEIIGHFACAGNSGNGPMCVFEFEQAWPRISLPTRFEAPLANVGGTRIMAERDDGSWALQALRLNHD